MYEIDDATPRARPSMAALEPSSTRRSAGSFAKVRSSRAYHVDRRHREGKQWRGIIRRSREPIPQSFDGQFIADAKERVRLEIELGMDMRSAARCPRRSSPFREALAKRSRGRLAAATGSSTSDRILLLVAAQAAALHYRRPS